MGKCKVQSGNDFYDEILNNRKKLRRYKIYALCIAPYYILCIIYYIFASVAHSWSKKNKTAIEGKNLNLYNIYVFFTIILTSWFIL